VSSNSPIEPVWGLELVVEDRQHETAIVDQRGGGAMGGHHQGLDRPTGRHHAELLEQPLPHALAVQVQVWRPGQRGVAPGGLVADLTVPVEHQQLDVGLADVENADEPGVGHGRLLV
jgi:hypothetical protein